MIRNQIPFDTNLINYLENAVDAKYLAEQTPINKVPILKDGAQLILDSRVIVRYLTEKHQLPSLTIDEENAVSAVYSCLDTSVMLFLLKRDGFNIDGPESFMQRNRERIPNNLKFVTNWATGLDPKRDENWNYASISLFSYLYWAKKRNLLTDLKPYPGLEEFLQKFAGAPGVRETSFD